MQPQAAPHKKGKSMSEDEQGGLLPLQDVIWVLTSMGSGAHRNSGTDVDGSTCLMIVNNEDVPEVIYLIDPVCRKMINYIARKTDIPVSYFYNMELIQEHTDEMKH